MQYYGFKDDWTLGGLKSYFEKHSQRPVSQYVSHCAEHPGQAAPVRERQAIRKSSICRRFLIEQRRTNRTERGE